MKKINKIKNGFLSRQIGVAKLAYKTGKNLVKSKESDLKEKLQDSFESHVEDIVSELDVMKGSLMKAGQMLSTLGGAFLPPQAQAILKKLENNTSYLQWDQIKKEIPENWQKELNISHDAIAAASLGQVHLGEFEGSKYAVKIQYKGVRKAIKNDLRALKLLLRAMNVIPKEIDLKAIYKEIEEMLLKETDYEIEKENTEYFQNQLKDNLNFKVPSVLSDYSNHKIIVTEFIHGHNLHDIADLKLTQDDKNRLGIEFIKLLFQEIFIFEKMQTDAHFGNYLITTNEKNEPIWGLIDFGATKSPSKEFINNYKRLLVHLRNKDQEGFIETLKYMGYISQEKESNIDLFWEYALTVGAPFYTEEFDWGNAQIADKILDYIPKIAKSIAIGNPPSDSLFLDKKIAGVYFILQKLEAKFNVSEVFDEVYENSQ